MTNRAFGAHGGTLLGREETRAARRAGPKFFGPKTGITRCAAVFSLRHSLRACSAWSTLWQTRCQPPCLPDTPRTRKRRAGRRRTLCRTSDNSCRPRPLFGNTRVHIEYIPWCFLQPQTVPLHTTRTRSVFSATRAGPADRLHILHHHPVSYTHLTLPTNREV